MKAGFCLHRGVRWCLVLSVAFIGVLHVEALFEGGDEAVPVVERAVELHPVRVVFHDDEIAERTIIIHGILLVFDGANRFATLNLLSQVRVG